MKLKANAMEKLVDKFDLHPKDDFIVDPTIDIYERGGGYPKFPKKPIDPADPVAADLQRRWLAITTQLVKVITNPHIGRDDIKAVFNGIGMLGGLYAEKFKSK